MAHLRYPPYSKITEIFPNDRLRLELLFYCISFAVNWGSFPLDRYLEGILGNVGSVGGDPGWRLCPEDREGATYPEQWDACIAKSKHPELGCYEAWALSDISDITPETAYYTVEEVRHYIRIALDNIALQHPERAADVKEIIVRYGLESTEL